ncbi:2-dehydropantoate 2-reductase [Brevibacillus fulvus]|uniref:2-dehydropantoate 2-reductase n=1 Tax=Brevibacillus fulvus TaxID=1125967 RepID=A0A939BT18_9BACL|nr:2-dehydropantoate 2-reductase [Brevibacillus fulvus]MBM7591063.1 2-dehydropantoate 2-reductase [Brevibacillus fulvus]
MKVLVLGAGAVGGYFGGRLAEKGADVTFLVREKRRIQLEERGLRIASVNGDAHLQPKLLTAGEGKEAYDLVMLATKAYHLNAAVETIADYIGTHTMILPMLNGIAHIDSLKQRFGAERVLGGLCFIESTLNSEGDVIQTSKNHNLVYGEWEGGRSERVTVLEELFAGANANFVMSEFIQREMWHKYLFITTLSGMTTLMNAAVGPIRDSAYGKELTRQLAEEVAAIMRAVGAPIADHVVDMQTEVFLNQGYKMKASMLRDMEKGLPVEAEHLQGHLLRLADANGVQVPLLRIVYNNLKVYEIKRAASIEV